MTTKDAISSRFHSRAGGIIYFLQSPYSSSPVASPVSVYWYIHIGRQASLACKNISIQSSFLTLRISHTHTRTHTHTHTHTHSADRNPLQHFPLGLISKEPGVMIGEGGGGKEGEGTGRWEGGREGGASCHLGAINLNLNARDTVQHTEGGGDGRVNLCHTVFCRLPRCMYVAYVCLSKSPCLLCNCACVCARVCVCLCKCVWHKHAIWLDASFVNFLCICVAFLVYLVCFSSLHKFSKLCRIILRINLSQ